MPFVSLTRLRVRKLRFLPSFALHAMASNGQVQRAQGFRAGSLLPDRRLVFWTMTAWDDMAAMRAYMTSGAHRTAMPHLLHWCDEASVAHWDQEEDALPGWAEAERRMRQHGRPSKVRHSAPGHDDLAFAPARITRAAPLRPLRSS